MSTQVYVNGVLRELWDDATSTYTAYDETGAQTSSRPYTPEEQAAADEAAAANVPIENKSTIETNLAEDLDAMQVIIDTPNADLRADPSQEIKDIARAVRRLTRMALDDYSGTE